MELIDTHAHIDGEDFDADRDEVIQRALQAGVTRIVNIGATSGFEGAHRTIALTEKYDCIWGTVGLHPHDTDRPLDLGGLRYLASHNKIKAIGETGLDFFRDWAPRDKQYEWFRAQVELALDLKMPIIIHSRDAGEECLQVLEEVGAAEVGGVFHCYAESADFAERLQQINFIVSVPGSLTFKKADQLRAAIEQIPLERIMVETDSPYIAPVPYRGKRCEPAYVLETATKLAEVKGLTLAAVAEATTATARAFYGI